MKSISKMISGSDFYEIGDLATGGIILPYLPEKSRKFASMLIEDNILDLLSCEE